MAKKPEKNFRFDTLEEFTAYLKRHGISLDDPEALGKAAAHAAPDVQKQIESEVARVGGGTGSNSKMSPFHKALFNERRGQFAKGTVLPGVDEATGAGLGNPREIAQTIEARSAYDLHKTSTEVSDNPKDYAYQPTPEKDVGWRPGERYQTQGAAPEEQASLLENPIDQQRSDTTGIDAQKALLGTYQSLYKQGGLDAIDRARINKSQQMRGAEYRGAVGAAEQSAEQQGRFGGPAMLLSKIKSASDMTNRRASDDLETSALGLQRRESLLTGQGQVAGQIQTAQDAIDQFNTQGERDRARANQVATNAATHDTYGANEARQAHNVDIANRGVDQAFGYETDYNRHASDASTTASASNVSPNQGARGHTKDVIAAQEAAMDAGHAQASGIRGDENDTEEQRAARAAIGAGYVKSGVDFTTRFIPGQH